MTVKATVKLTAKELAIAERLLAAARQQPGEWLSCEVLLHQPARYDRRDVARRLASLGALPRFGLMWRFVDSELFIRCHRDAQPRQDDFPFAEVG